MASKLSKAFHLSVFLILIILLASVAQSQSVSQIWGRPSTCEEARKDPFNLGLCRVDIKFKRVVVHNYRGTFDARRDGGTFYGTLEVSYLHPSALQNTLKVKMGTYLNNPMIVRPFEGGRVETPVSEAYRLGRDDMTLKIQPVCTGKICTKYALRGSYRKNRLLHFDTPSLTFLKSDGKKVYSRCEVNFLIPRGASRQINDRRSCPFLEGCPGRRRAAIYTARSDKRLTVQPHLDEIKYKICKESFGDGPIDYNEFSAS